MAAFRMVRLVVSYLFIAIWSANANSHVPLLMWESPNSDGRDVSSSALSKFSSEEFAELLLQRVDHNPLVVLFLEETLSVEDFSRQDVDSRVAFPALQNVVQDSEVQFFPAVQNPEKAINRLVKQGYKWEKLTSETLPEGGKKVLLVTLEDAKPAEDRRKMLTRHDQYIASLFRRIAKNYPHVVAIYTGQHASWIAPESVHRRFRRDTESENLEEQREEADDCIKPLRTQGDLHFLFYTTSCPVLKINDTMFQLVNATATASDKRGNNLQRFIVNAVLNGTAKEKVTLRFRFLSSDDGYWNMTQVEVERNAKEKYILETKSEIGASMNFSYSCSRSVTFENAAEGITLTLNNIQIQPDARNGKFDISEDCIQFFTAGIWSGLFVTFILLLIVGWGIDMMMGIRTNDRFDDSKGKPLFINAQE